MVSDEDQKWMRYALALAVKAADAGEVPVGAVVVCDNRAIGEGWNHPIAAHDPTAHAEIMALRAAAREQKNYRVVDSTLYVTLEPCTMCVGAIVHARVSRVVFGAKEPKAGAVVSQNNLFDHPAMNARVLYEGGVLEAECSTMLSEFFKLRRQQKREEKAKDQSKSTDTNVSVPPR